MHRRELTRGNRCNAIVATCVTIGLIFLGQQALAGEEKNAGRNVSTLVDAKIVKVGDVGGHVLGRYEGKGVTFHPDGETSTYIQTGAFDYVKRAGSHKGYIIRTYPDGAMTTSTYRGTARHTDKGRRFNGTFEIVSGTGRFAGATGKGTYDGFSTKVGMGIVDWEGVIAVPTN